MRVAFSFTNHRKAKHLKGYFAFFVCLKTHEVFERFARPYSDEWALKSCLNNFSLK